MSTSSDKPIKTQSAKRSSHPTGNEPLPAFLRRVAIGVVIAAIVQLVLLWGTSLPLGIPEEWTWARCDFSVLDLGGLLAPFLAGVFLCGIASFVAPRINQFTQRGKATALLLLWGCGVVWLFSTVSAAPGIAGLSRAPFVLYYTRSSGYFTQAREDVTNVREFLRTYRERINDSSQPENYLHLGTHPPGLTLSIVGIRNACEHLPALRAFLKTTQPASIRESLTTISQLITPEARETWETDSATLWAMTVIVALLATGACVPLYLLCRRTVSSEVAVWVATFWLLVPAMAIFFPKSDVMFAGLAMWIQWLWLEGVTRRSVRFGIAAGTLIFIAVNLSLAFVPIGLILVLQGFCVDRRLQTDSSAENRGIEWARARIYWSSALAFFALILLAWLIGEINLIDVWFQNLRNHAAFYDHATRTYLAWLIVNPIELSIAIGMPLFLMGLLGLWTIFSESQNTRPWLAVLSSRGEILIPILVWAILWVSGKNMGEAARLWGFLMPYAVWLTAFLLEKWHRNDRFPRWVRGLFLVQMVTCVATVIRIDGFHFAELLS